MDVSRAALSSYLVGKTGMYGGSQEPYLARAETVIESGVKMVREGMASSSGSLPELFFEVLGHFSCQRHDIAVSLGTEDAEDFGKSRLPAPGAFCNYRYHAIKGSI